MGNASPAAAELIVECQFKVADALLLLQFDDEWSSSVQESLPYPAGADSVARILLAILKTADKFAYDLSKFFFSSRRRHTRSYGDWSSDVCSSDLTAEMRARVTTERRGRPNNWLSADPWSRTRARSQSTKRGSRW